MAGNSGTPVDRVAPVTSQDGRQTTRLVLGLVFCGVVAGIALAVLVWREIDRRSAPAIVIEAASLDATIVTSVEGMVATPGVYSLPGSARVNDVVTAAGGFLPGADLAEVNLAARVVDGQRLVVPALVPTAVAGDATRPVATGVPARSPATQASQPVVGAAPAAVNINTASQAELESLPGIGPAIAANIIAYREANGRFTSIDDLVAVDRISQEMVDDLRPLITLDS